MMSSPPLAAAFFFAAMELLSLHAEPADSVEPNDPGSFRPTPPRRIAADECRWFTPASQGGNGQKDAILGTDGRFRAVSPPALGARGSPPAGSGRRPRPSRETSAAPRLRERR